MPPWFRPSAGGARTIWSALPERLRGLPLARRASGRRTWFDARARDRTLDRLRALGLSYVSVDEPQGTPASVPPLAVATHRRLRRRALPRPARATRGRKPGVGTSERFRYLYRPTELAEWVPRLRDARADDARRVLVLMNNCHRESAVQNAKDLARLLAGGAIPSER